VESIALGSRIKEARVAAGLTQQALAFKAGIALRTLSHIENGEDTKLSTLRAIAGVLDVPLTDLISDDIPAA
jgi:transcriptional regulator with XRE-family HTH domain